MAVALALARLPLALCACGAGVWFINDGAEEDGSGHDERVGNQTP